MRFAISVRFGVTWFEKNPTFLKNSLFQRDKSTPGAGFISNLLSFCLNESQIYCLFLQINEVNMTANSRGVQNIRTINRLGSPAPLKFLDNKSFFSKKKKNLNCYWYPRFSI